MKKICCIATLQGIEHGAPSFRPRMFDPAPMRLDGFAWHDYVVSLECVGEKREDYFGRSSSLYVRVLHWRIGGTMPATSC